MEKLNIQPSEIDMLPFYEYEYTISLYNDIVKDRKDSEDNTTARESSQFNMPSLKSSMPKMPNMGGIKLPKM